MLKDNNRLVFVSSTNSDDSNNNVSNATIIPENHTLKIAIISPRIQKISRRPVTWSTTSLVAALLGIDVINNKTDNLFDDILPNTTIVYEFYDSLQDTETTVKLASTILDTAFKGKGADVVLGAGTSGSSMALQSILKFFNIPQVSSSATSGYLSILQDYPFFSRLVPTDGLLTNAMIQFAKYIIGWKSGAIICGNDAYSIYGGTTLNKAANSHDFHITAFEVFQSDTENMHNQVNNAVRTGARLFFFFGRASDIKTFFVALYNSLVARGDIADGFSVIYADSMSAILVDTLKKEFVKTDTQYIFDTIINGSYSVTFSIRGGNTSKIFRQMYEKEIESNGNCFEQNITGKCSYCLKHRIDPRTNSPIFHIDNYLKNVATKRCIAPNNRSDPGYYPQFSFDSIIMIAHAYDYIIKKKHKTTFNGEDFMNVVSNPSFKFHGATGKVMLDKNGDRIQEGIAMDIWSLRSINSDNNNRYLVGNLDISGAQQTFNFCTFSGTVKLHGNGNLCMPKFIFNTKTGIRPDPKHRTLLNINLAIITSTFRANIPYALDATGNQRTLAMLVAIEEINNKSNPFRQKYFNSTPPIIYKWKNSRRSSSHAAVAGSAFLGSTFIGEGTDAVIGALSSGPTMALQTIMKFNNILQISPSATSPALADKITYPSFARTVPSDLIMSRMLVIFLKSVLKWSEVGIISSNTPYSYGGMKAIVSAAKEFQVAITINAVVESGEENMMFQKSVDALQGGNRVFIVFVHTSDILMICRSMELAAEFLSIDISTIVLIFSETISINFNYVARPWVKRNCCSCLAKTQKKVGAERPNEALYKKIHDGHGKRRSELMVKTQTKVVPKRSVTRLVSVNFKILVRTNDALNKKIHDDHGRRRSQLMMKVRNKENARHDKTCHHHRLYVVDSIMFLIHCQKVVKGF